MKNWKGLITVVMIMAVALLTAGCPKKPAATPAVEAPTETTAAEQTDNGFSGEAVTENAPTDSAVTAPASMERIYFDFDQYTLSSSARQTLEANAAFLKANPMVKARIEGHADERGSDEYNLALGERRARAARDYVVSLGVSPDRLAIISYGEEVPLDPRHTEDAWAKNRRAEFTVAR